MHFVSEYSIHQKVFIGDDTVRGFVTAVLFREARPPHYEVTWMHNGEVRTAWVEGILLRSVE